MALPAHLYTRLQHPYKGSFDYNANLLRLDNRVVAKLCRLLQEIQRKQPHGTVLHSFFQASKVESSRTNDAGYLAAQLGTIQLTVEFSLFF